MAAAAILAVILGWPGWSVAFDGYGAAGAVRDRVLGAAIELRPRASVAANETHAALVLNRGSFRDFDEQVRVRPVRPLRALSPNPWETGWILWHYSDNAHFYYLALKPNGWELGKEDPAYPDAQRFLATGSNVTFPFGRTYAVRIEQRANAISVYADGRKLASFTDGDHPYSSGAFGLYCEDSQVRFGLPQVQLF